MSNLKFEGLWPRWPQVQASDLRVTIPVFSLTETPPAAQFPAWLTKVHSAGRGRVDSRQVCPGPLHLVCQPEPCQLLWALPKPPVADVLPVWFLEKDEDKGRDRVRLVHPAVSRWPVTVTGRGQSCGEPCLSGSLSSVPRERLDRAVTVARSARGLQTQGGRVLFGLLRRSCFLSQRWPYITSLAFPSAQRSTGHKDVAYTCSSPLEVSKLYQAGLLRAICV